jgi:hypothetical protein
MPLKRSVRAKATARSKKASTSRPRVKKSIVPAGAGVAGMVFALVVCGMAAAMVLAARESPDPADAPALAAHADVALPHVANGMRVMPAVATTTITTEPMAAAADSTGSPEGKSPAVTVAGCLARAGKSFRLTNTEGADAPKARSWKSGFLKKGSAPVEVVDASNRLRLSHHVGHRVALTGTLVDRQMQARSLQPIAASCN